MSLAETKALALSFLQSKVFEDAFVHGINPEALCAGLGAQQSIACARQRRLARWTAGRPLI